MATLVSPPSLFTSPLLLLALLSPIASAQRYGGGSCPVSVSSSVPAPSAAPGYEVRLVATDLTEPRGITFDSAGNLLVVESGRGVTALTLTDHGGACVGVESKRNVVNDDELNHGITLSPSSRTLYASTSESVYAYPYYADARRVAAPRHTLIRNMTTSDHTTRTLLLSRAKPGTLVVTKGSTSNIDLQAEELETGHSTVKAFPVGGDVNRTRDRNPAQDYNTDGTLLGWGLRNEVGIAEEPVHGGIYGIENSADELVREGVDIHVDNPAEELNFMGYLNAERTAPDGRQSPNQGQNFGYPSCFTAWDPSAIPNFDKPVGTQFSLAQNSTQNDTACAESYVAPSLSFQAHMAPLDIKFNRRGSTAWIAFHGSWDRDDPVGYKIGAVAFADGGPSADTTSKRALTDIVWNADNSRCPDQCFRPVGLAWDTRGRLFFSSDDTGEIYVVSRRTRGNVNAARVPVQASGTSGDGGGDGDANSPSSTTTSGSQAKSQYTGVSSALAGFVGAYLMA